MHTTLATALLAILSSGAALAQVIQEGALDELVVESSRAKLVELRRAMVNAEDRFYERYNQLNTDDDFDVHCAEEARTGTRLERRYCRPVFEAAEMEREGEEYFWYLHRSETDEAFRMASGQAGGLIGAPPSPAILQIEARRPEFRRTMREITGNNPELISLLRERSDLAKQYEQARRKLFRKPASGS
jgi:hypothetical protein